MFITGKESIADKLYLLAAATGGTILSQTVLQGAGGMKLQYKPNEFRRLGKEHIGIHCTDAFRAKYPEFVKTLSWLVEKEGWRRLKATSLDKKKSICLVAEEDLAAKTVRKQAKLALTKSNFVAFVTSKCQAKEKSFFVKCL